MRVSCVGEFVICVRTICVCAPVSVYARERVSLYAPKLVFCASHTHTHAHSALVYAGYLRPAPPASSAQTPGGFAQAILLHATPTLLENERSRVHSFAPPLPTRLSHAPL